jgi:putative nucleotidyltransferase with HDIG domain
MLKMTETYHGWGNGVIENPYHLEGSVWTHTKMVMDEVEKYFVSDYALMICALLHDIGKVKTFRDNSETKRRSFNNHEGVSVMMASDILKKLSYSWGDTEISPHEREEILKVIGLHGRLYDFIGRKDKIKDVAIMFKKEPGTLERLRRFYLCDHGGRITDPNVDNITVLEATDWFFKVIKYICILDYEEEVEEQESQKNITVLIGLPRSGKSTYVKDHFSTDVVISRDDLVMEYARDGETYSEVWNRLIDENQKNIDKELQKRYNKAVKAGVDLVIDMTNTSKKSRKKWLANARGYHKKAIVFGTGIDTCDSRNSKDKNIPREVLESMAKRFVVPLYDEFDEIEWRV